MSCWLLDWLCSLQSCSTMESAIYLDIGQPGFLSWMRPPAARLASKSECRTAEWPPAWPWKCSRAQAPLWHQRFSVHGWIFLDQSWPTGGVGSPSRIRRRRFHKSLTSTLLYIFPIQVRTDFSSAAHNIQFCFFRKAKGKKVWTKFLFSGSGKLNFFRLDSKFSLCYCLNKLRVPKKKLSIEEGTKVGEKKNILSL